MYCSIEQGGNHMKRRISIIPLVVCAISNSCFSAKVPEASDCMILSLILLFLGLHFGELIEMIQAKASSSPFAIFLTIYILTYCSYYTIVAVQFTSIVYVPIALLSFFAGALIYELESQQLPLNQIKIVINFTIFIWFKLFLCFYFYNNFLIFCCYFCFISWFYVSVQYFFCQFIF